MRDNEAVLKDAAASAFRDQALSTAAAQAKQQQLHSPLQVSPSASKVSLSQACAYYACLPRQYISQGMDSS